MARARLLNSHGAVLAQRLAALLTIALPFKPVDLFPGGHRLDVKAGDFGVEQRCARDARRAQKHLSRVW
jgi:hypothetical protein